MEDFYDLLEVSGDASTEEINRAWRRKVRRYHPDVNDDARANAQFKTLKKAHEVLSDETERAAYDRLGHRKYVNQRLDGLPTRPFRTAGTESDSGTTTDTGDSDRSDGHHESGARSAGKRADRANGSDRSANAGRGAGRTTRAETSGAQSQRTAREKSSQKTTGKSQSNRTTATGTQSRQRASTATSGEEHRVDAGRSNRNDSASEGTSVGARHSRRRASPLLYGWSAVLLAGIAYLAGLWQYLRANAEAISSLGRAAPADPGALLSTYALVGPGQFALGASVETPISLLFPIGVVALALALVGVVAAFGRGFAYLYAVGGVAPVAGLAVGTVLSLPDGLVLVLVGLCPVVATAGFLLDVGRVAFGRRSGGS
ncbi:DnaJ domain-containing protein [Halobellus captivus]|uniref:DnaJ domain-containing protein n=1 Tax=Halobellus captivus TaxID=2592614 RepID=UPI0011A171D2|nr:DnaJ domain-containing protein [Halobellus captivus]